MARSPDSSSPPARPNPAFSSGTKSQVKRFYKAVEIVQQTDGYGIALDGRPVKTPGGRKLTVPTKGLAQALLEEWQAQAGRIDWTSMPLNRLAFTALDGVGPHIEAVRREIADYAASDLLCYRAPHPQALAAKQAAAWDPVLAWLAQSFDAVFETGEGITYIAQPPRSLQQIAVHLQRYGPFSLTALHVLTTLSGSVFLALAVQGRFCSAAQAWDYAHIDEDWQASHWGHDAEAEQRHNRRRAEFLTAARFLHLLAGASEQMS